MYQYSVEIDTLVLMVDVDAVKRRFESLLPTVDELMRRLIAAAESLAIAELERLPGVSSAERRGEAIVVHCGDSDAAIRALLQAYPGVRDIEIGGAGLEQAFLQLTGVGGTA